MITVVNFCQIIITLVMLLCASISYSKSDGVDPSYTIEKRSQEFVINLDGTFSMTQQSVFLINDERAIKTIGQGRLTYNKSLESLEVIEAYTLKSNNRRVVVQPDQIKDQQESQSVNAPMFQDTLVKTVIFPDVAVGDRLVLSYKRVRTTPLFPGQFEDLSRPHFNPIKDYWFSYELPETMALISDSRGFKAAEPVTRNGRTFYRYDYVPRDRARIENGSVAYSDYGDFLAVSTFKDWQSFAVAYDARASHKTLVNEKIRSLAQSIVATSSDTRTKAIALNDWVRRNIRYVAVFVGPGGVVPHDAAMVLDNRYGDCKDHATLLEALLKIVGIESTPALINLGNAHKLASAPTLGVLNHVITYIPSLDLFLDSTSDAIAGGYLHPFLLNKPTVLTKSGVMKQTPLSQTGKIDLNSKFVIAENGSAEFMFLQTSRGFGAELNRYVFRNMKPTDRNMTIQRMLHGIGLNGEGTLDVGDLEGTGSNYDLRISGKIENLLNLPGPNGMRTTSSLSGGIAGFVSSFQAEKVRTQAFMCLNNEVMEVASFEFPKAVSILAIPTPVTINSDKLAYSSSYDRQGNTLTVRRRFTTNDMNGFCSADDAKTIAPAIDLINKDLRSQVIFQEVP